MARKSFLTTVNDHGNVYSALMFVCPGCENELGEWGLHSLPVNSPNKTPQWDWDGNLELPTLSPSIFSKKGGGFVCHSFLKNGVFQFLDDCTHKYAGQSVPLPDLYEWVHSGE